MTSDNNNIIKVDFKRKPQEDPVLLLDNVDVAFALWACNMFGVQYIDIDDLESVSYTHLTLPTKRIV